MKSDEKLCPFCAETIKAAAVKCRYCGSELPPAEATPAAPAVPVVSLDKPEPPPAAEPVGGSGPSPAPEPAEGEPEERPGRGGLVASRALTLPLALLVLVLAVALAFAITHARKDTVAPDGQVTSAGTRAALLDLAPRMTASALSYRAKSFDKDVATATRLMTVSMRKQYLDTVSKVRNSVRKHGLDLQAKVVASSLISVTDDQARLLEFVDQTTTAKGVKTQQFDEHRLVVTLDRFNGRWRISAMDDF